MIKINVGYTAYAFIDDCDLPLVSPYMWSLDSYGYAVAKIWINGVRKTVKLHRLIAEDMELNLVLDTDHKDLIPLNCRRENLREATKAQNKANSKMHSKLGITGVKKNGNAYVSKIKINNVYYHLGCFGNLLEAHYAYLIAAQLIYGEYAYVEDISKFEILSIGWKKKIEILIRVKLNLPLQIQLFLRDR